MLEDYIALRTPALDYWSYAILSIMFVPILTYTLTSIKAAHALRSQKSEQIPPIMPYCLPFLGNVVDFARDAPGFAAKISRRFGFSIPVRVRFGPFKAYFISNASHFDTILKGTRNLNSTPGLNLVLQTFFGVPKEVAAFYSRDNSGMNATPLPGTNVASHHRINHLRFSAAQKYLYGQHLSGMTTRFLEELRKQIDAIEEIGEDWVEYQNLTEWSQKLVFTATTTALCGSYMFELNPTFNEDFWEYIRHIPILYKGLPRWWSPKAYKARDKCLAAIKKWHLHAWEHVDHSRDDDSVAWEPYFGARIMRTRYTYAKEMEATTDESRAAEDLGMIFAANANAVPATIWLILEVILSPSLLSRVRNEITTTLLPNALPSSASTPNIPHTRHNSGPPFPSFNLTLLTSLPLLQSIYSETLRLRIAVVLMRSPEKEDFKLGRWLFKKGDLIFLNSATAARNRDVWNEGTEKEPHHLDEFWPERFLSYEHDPNSGPVKRKENAASNTPATPPPFSKEPARIPSNHPISSEPDSVPPQAHGTPRFTLTSLSGAFVPFGGGVRMCPGRFFAKNELLASLAMLVSCFDFEVNMGHRWKPQPDMRYWLVGALPPKGEIRFRVRRRIEGQIKVEN